MKDNYKFVGKISVIELINFVSSLSEEQWEEEKSRQTLFDAHQHTQTIPILWDLKSFSTTNIAKKTKYYQDFKDKFIDEIKKQLFITYGNGEILRIVIVKLKANKEILSHTDIGEALSKSKRIHIPIITNKNVLFYVDDEEKNMKVGEMWEINNQKEHSVQNNSDQDRIHLIVDYYQHQH